MSYFPTSRAKSAATAAASAASAPAPVFYILVTDGVKGRNTPVRHQTYKTVQEYMTANSINPDKVDWFVERSGGLPHGFSLTSPLNSGDQLYISASEVKNG